MRYIPLLAICLLAANRLTAADPTALERLAASLTGTFSTSEQARSDQNFRDVTLHGVRIWPGSSDGPWLYAEQTLTDAPDHPYRQRIYQLVARSDGALELRVFELNDPIGFTRAWQDPARFAKLDPASLIARVGCAVILHLQPDGSFKGGTEGRGCASTLGGASYTTSEATISARQLITWDRGYNAAGTQVWGSIHGGFIFQRVE
jgi:CpeT protein